MDSVDVLTAAATHAWDLGWERLFDTRTNLFYDYVSSYDPAHRFDHLPTPGEIARQYPNRNGWTSGMEDSTINGGVMLAAACDRYAVTGERFLHGAAAALFAGLYQGATLSPERGLVLRSISPLDRKSYFIETSRDQLTHFAHGAWRYFHSPLCGATQQAQIRQAVASLCQRLEARVTPENQYHFGREDGTPGLVDQMWEVLPHEAPRLPMIYAVGWDVTGEPHWRDLYQRYAEPALVRAEAIDFSIFPWAYALYQHQVSMDVLVAVADGSDPLRPRWQAQMDRVADCAETYLRQFDAYQPVDVGTLTMDFRTWPNGPAFCEGGPHAGYGHVPEWPEPMLRCEFRPLRNAAEALLIRLMAPNRTLSHDAEDVLCRSLTQVDYSLTFGYSMLMPQAALWRCAANLAAQA